MSNLEQRHFKTGETIMSQGDQGDNAYMIEKGRVEILIETADGHQSVGTRGEGTIIGEMALIDDKPRIATIKALEECDLIEITRFEFNRRLEKSDPVMQMVMQVILTRYRDMLARATILSDSLDTPEDLEREYAEKSNAAHDLKIANDLEQALLDDNLVLHYQPMINLQTGEIHGFEALMRWDHPEKGPIPPDVFIPIAEETGMIVKASLWAFQTACTALADVIKQTSNDDLFMSVNFSSEDFNNPSLPNKLMSILNETGLKPHHVHLEITERLLIAHPSMAEKTLAECEKMGMSISIDDFGTGYSSLSYLHNYPISILKIDRSFILNMSQDKSAKALVQSIITLGQNLGMKVIAEGIETIKEAQDMRAMGCDSAQGYYFARPQDLSSILELLNGHSGAEAFQF